MDVGRAWEILGKAKLIPFDASTTQQSLHEEEQPFVWRAGPHLTGGDPRAPRMPPLPPDFSPVNGRTAKQDLGLSVTGSVMRTVPTTNAATSSSRCGLDQSKVLIEDKRATIKTSAHCVRQLFHNNAEAIISVACS